MAGELKPQVIASLSLLYQFLLSNSSNRIKHKLPAFAELRFVQFAVISSIPVTMESVSSASSKKSHPALS